MRKKIAKAICYADEQNGGPPWEYIEQLGKHAINAYYDRADAVLDVLMEPTEGMLKASYGIDEFWSDGPDHAAVFKAAIQAAKEGK